MTKRAPSFRGCSAGCPSRDHAERAVLPAMIWRVERSLETHSKPVSAVMSSTFYDKDELRSVGCRRRRRLRLVFANRTRAGFGECARNGSSAKSRRHFRAAGWLPPFQIKRALPRIMARPYAASAPRQVELSLAAHEEFQRSKGARIRRADFGKRCS